MFVMVLSRANNDRRFTEFELVEINAHSLFSKWFSESGKMVTELFTRIRQLLKNPARFLCILIDEVESLAAARSAAMAGSDPSDAIRVSGALAGDSHDTPVVARF